MVIDDDDDNHIYASGGISEGFGMMMKFTHSLDEVYTYVSPSNNHFQDIAFKGDKQLVTATARRNAPTNPHLILRPNGDYITNLYCKPEGVDHYTVVDEEMANGDTDYISASVTATYINDTFEFANVSEIREEINSVTIYARTAIGGALADGGVPNMCKLIVRNETVTYSPAFLIPGRWDDVSYTFSVNPETGDSWTWGDIDNLKVGIAFMGTMWTFMGCTQLYIDVDYEPFEDQYTVTLHRKSNGAILGRYDVGDVHDAPHSRVDDTIGVAVDSEENILASGGRGAIDTMKVRIISCTIPPILIAPAEEGGQILES